MQQDREKCMKRLVMSEGRQNMIQRDNDKQARPMTRRQQNNDT